MESGPENEVYRFGCFEADAVLGELRSNGDRVALQEQPFQVLLVFVRSPGQLITREQLRHSIWPENTFVEFDSALNTAVKKIRSALGDDANAPSYVETVPRRGYRFIASVQVSNGKPASEFLAERTRWMPYLWVGAGLVGFAAGYLFRLWMAAH